MSHTGPNSFIGHMEARFAEKGLAYDHLLNSLYPQIAICLVAYLAFIFLNNYVIPRYYPQKDYNRIGLLTLGAFVLTLTVFSLAFYYQDMLYESNLSYYFVRNAPVVAGLFCAYFLYAFIKKIIEFYLFNPEKQKSLFSRILRDTLLVLAVWFLVLAWIMGTNSMRTLGPVWIGIFPYAYALYQISLYRFIPRYENSREKPAPAIARAVLFAALLFLPFMLILASMGSHPGYLFISWLFSTAAAIGIAYIVYQQNKERILELVFLKKELGRVNSGLQFLRSQINPHFLFNALNTLYGTSLQENAAKTGEGIQKLGDMMRFMLHENHQDTISLAREIEYLEDYIHLQKLRLAQSESIRIETNIHDDLCFGHSIAPMLLIPFVENAFKHGISLRKSSWIKIALKCDNQRLYFDIYNSIHRKNEDDPERQNKGIGLENVRQRLMLIYQGKHELVIRENESEYFVHLTIELK
ncbi:histidine kinase [Anseongella ginsenosidimutans]|nr:histidine kinase [Anseongella ginsenosidimutans]